MPNFYSKDCPQRQQFLRKIEQLMSKLLTYAPVDAAVDQMAKKFVHDSLPPVLTESKGLCQDFFFNLKHLHPVKQNNPGSFS